MELQPPFPSEGAPFAHFSSGVAATVINLSTRSVTNAGKEIEFSGVPLRLLLLLASRRDHVWTRPEIEAAIWGGYASPRIFTSRFAPLGRRAAYLKL